MHTKQHEREDGGDSGEESKAAFDDRAWGEETYFILLKFSLAISTIILRINQ